VAVGAELLRQPVFGRQARARRVLATGDVLRELLGNGGPHAFAVGMKLVCFFGVHEVLCHKIDTPSAYASIHEFI
jgi:hypothetical protein